MEKFLYDMETVPLARWIRQDPSGKPADRVFACDRAGECRVEDIVDEIRSGLVEWMNERGLDGWRLAHMEVHAEVVLLVWEKRGHGA